MYVSLYGEVTCCWFTCKWDAASMVTWSSYYAAAVHRCSAPRCHL